MTIRVNARNMTEKGRASLQAMNEIRGREIELADHFLQVIRDRTPVKTGETARSWHIHHEQDPNGIRWTISPDGRELIVTYLEFGTREHVIVPKGTFAAQYFGHSASGVLRFETETGEVVFTKRVYHPGTKPLGIVKQTQSEIKEEGRKLIRRLHTKLRQIWLTGR